MWVSVEISIDLWRKKVLETQQLVVDCSKHNNCAIINTPNHCLDEVAVQEDLGWQTRDVRMLWDGQGEGSHDSSLYKENF